MIYSLSVKTVQRLQLRYVYAPAAAQVTHSNTQWELSELENCDLTSIRLDAAAANAIVTSRYRFSSYCHCCCCQ